MVINISAGALKGEMEISAQVNGLVKVPLVRAYLTFSYFVDELIAELNGVFGLPRMLAKVDFLEAIC